MQNELSKEQLTKTFGELATAFRTTNIQSVRSEELAETSFALRQGVEGLRNAVEDLLRPVKEQISMALLATGGETDLEMQRLLSRDEENVKLAVTSLLRDQNEHLRRNMLWWVVRTKTELPDALPVFLSLLSDQSTEVRLHSIEVVTLFWKGDESIIPALIPRLADSNANIAMQAADLLGSFGVRAAQAAPALRTIIATTSFPESIHAAAALGRIGAEAEYILPLLTTVIRNPGGAYGLIDQTLAARGLGGLGSQAKTVLPSLHEAARRWGEDSCVTKVIQEAIVQIEAAVAEAK